MLMVILFSILPNSLFCSFDCVVILQNNSKGREGETGRRSAREVYHLLSYWVCVMGQAFRKCVLAITAHAGYSNTWHLIFVLVGLYHLSKQIGHNRYIFPPKGYGWLMHM